MARLRGRIERLEREAPAEPARVELFFRDELGRWRNPATGELLPDDAELERRNLLAVLIGGNESGC